MGMFDSVWFECPNCKSRIEAQSKGGDCYLNNYTPDKVPYDVARDAHIYDPCKCGIKYQVKELPEPSYVTLELVVESQHNVDKE